MSCCDSILVRCKELIEQLQQELLIKTVDCQQKQITIENLTNQRNNINDKNKELQKLIFDMKQANIVLRNHLKKNTQNQSLQQQLAILTKKLKETKLKLQRKQEKIRQISIELSSIQKDKVNSLHSNIAVNNIVHRIQSLEEELQVIKQENSKLREMLKVSSCQNCKNVQNISKNKSSNARKVIFNDNFSLDKSKTGLSTTSKLLSCRTNKRVNVDDKQLQMRDRINITDGIDISPFTYEVKIKNARNKKQEPELIKRNLTKQNVVEQTLREIENKLQEMGQLMEKDQSEDSTLIIR